MEAIFDIIDFLVRDPFTLILALLAATTFGALAVGGQFVLARADVKRRTARLTETAGSSGTQADKASAKEGLQRLTQSLDRLFGEANDSAKKILRKKLIQAGYYAPSAPATYLAIRLGGLLLFGATGLLIGLFVSDDLLNDAYIKMVGGAALGYFLPSTLLDNKINMRKDEHRAGFPDFLDLMIVCSEAGLSMEASINRVCQEMTASYPSLSANLYFTTLEIRAGRTMNDALQNLADRLAIDEARTFATLLQQSAELGSSLVDSLKVYSEEMRNKRMMRAEEKATALPTKMMVPMMIFIFPILFIILLFPAYLQAIESWK